MPSLRRLAGIALLALFALGFAASTARALATAGDCCAGMEGGAAPDRAPASCASLAASACCERFTPGPAQPVPAAPALACAAPPPASPARALTRLPRAAAEAPFPRRALATTVLRL